MTDVAAYERLAELAELELEYAGRGQVDRIMALIRERTAIVETLPKKPPPAALHALQRALMLQERTTIDLIRGREQLLLTLMSLRKTQRAANGYGATVAHVSRTDQLA
jgi:hypothetical protein